MSFPVDGPTLMDMIDVREDGSFETNLQALVDAHGDRSCRGGWSAPRSFAKGDILLFYHSKRALPRIRRMFLNAFEQSGWHAVAGPDRNPDSIHRQLANLDENWRHILEMLIEEHRLALLYQGSIFACARLTDRPLVDTSADERERSKHWRSPVYAGIRDVFVFAEPLPDTEFTRFVTLSTGGGFTYVEAAAFNAIREALGRASRLPAYFRDAVAGGAGFGGITRHNWRGRVCTPASPRFLNEAQLRAYFADFLLAELKDPRSAVLEECRCLAPTPGPIADYFVRVGGAWLPVETKLNVKTESHLTLQVERYLGVTEVVPTRGAKSGTPQRVAGADVCLVVDAEGAYLLDRDGFVDCSADRPLVSRRQFGRDGTGPLRERLLHGLSDVG